MAQCNPEEFIQLFQRIVHKYSQFETHKKKYGTDMHITVAEIHTIDAIGRNSNLNLKQLAQELGIAKGTASQMVYKLVDKGLVKKEISVHSDREINISLTKLGRTAYDGHKEMHAGQNAKMTSLVKEMPQDVLDLSKDYLVQFEGLLDKYLAQEE